MSFQTALLFQVLFFEFFYVQRFQFIVGFVWINVILQIEVNFEQVGSIVIVPLGYIILSLLIAFTITIMGTGW